MYILINDSNRPFAIVENNTNMRIEKAIAEEYLYEEVGLIGEIVLPDWGETSDNVRQDYSEIEYEGRNYLFRT